MDEQPGHVLIIGGANLDITGRPDAALVSHSSTPGRIRNSLGGVARNIAENLTRLDVETVLLTAVGEDDAGSRILGRAAGSGIDISNALVIDGESTGAYMAILAADGSLNIAIDDMSVTCNLTPEYFRLHQTLFQDAELVVVDANLTPEALETVVELCTLFKVRLCADPTSTGLADRLKPYLSQIYMLSPNVPEAQTLCDLDFDADDVDAVMTAARKLVALGVEIAVITLGEHGVVYASAETAGQIPAVTTEVVNLTGAGDAMTAAIIFGLLEDIPLDECMRLGVTAATLTLRTINTVRHDLSIDLLYDELVI